MIPTNLIKKYNIGTVEEFVQLGCTSKDAHIMVYTSFLQATDFICNLIAEDAATWEDYPEEKKYREIAREQIRVLSE